jgi:6-phosphogluconolactonase
LRDALFILQKVRSHAILNAPRRQQGHSLMTTVKPNPEQQQSHWHVFEDAEAVAHAALKRILGQAQTAIEARGSFHLVLAGGSTPRRVYELLRSCDADWRQWHIYFGDERCLPPEHPERNSRMAEEAWLAHVDIPAQQVHAIPAERGAEAGASEYSAVLHGLGHFDLVLLGLGEDGHTASLFPMQAWERAIAWPPVLPIHDAPKPPADRISLSPDRLSAAEAILFLVTGAGKAEAVRDWRQGMPIPASRIGHRAVGGHAAGVAVYLDQAAAGRT